MDHIGTPIHTLREKLDGLGKGNQPYYKRFQAGIALHADAGMSMPAIVVAALDLARWSIRDMIRSHFTDDSCAATAGFVNDIMNGMGVDAEAVPCYVTCLSPAFWAWAVQNSRLLPLTDEETDRLKAAGGKMVIIAGKPPADADEVHTLAEALGAAVRAQPDQNNRFPGHVANVLSTGDFEFLADLSIDQVQAKGLTAEPLIVPIPPGSFSKPGQSVAVMNNGTMLIYERIDDQSFRESPDFTRTHEDDPQFGSMMNALKTAMAMIISTAATGLASGGVVRGTPSSAMGEYRSLTHPEMKATIVDGFIRTFNEQVQPETKPATKKPKKARKTRKTR